MTVSGVSLCFSITAVDDGFEPLGVSLFWYFTHPLRSKCIIRTGARVISV